MKRILMSIAIVAFTITATQAQVNKTVKEESTVKRVVTKEGSDVKIKEIKNTDTESGAVIVEGNDKTNQEFSEATRKDSDNKVIVDDVVVDKQNEAMIAEKKAQQEAQLEASKREQEALAAKKKMEYEAKQAQMQKELAERRAQLESRPKGMAKLKKD
ncbi:hypothetical protein A7A78_01120 [Aequorivita soesokkakensis]|uniref:Uncharacterized protein n=1 Tax=Aequorivita soesokkakensis TaxID=1385699 RepID=A0A1A9LGT3_9FLAO|nr:hypothetical protein [Aequorivita soesokkakensis]OAD92538.1 hypothetical protein A7A78_01120 [Aequorivita soesokkakensis]